MERGFDKLQNMEGLTVIVLGAVLILGMIVVGAVVSTTVERENRKKRQAQQSKQDSPVGPIE